MPPPPSNDQPRAFQRLWDILRQDVSGAAVERFIRDEIPGAYGLYRRSIRDEPLPVGRFRRFFKIVWYLFLSFLEKLTPVRRVLFTVAVVLFLLWQVDIWPEYIDWAFVLLGLVLALEVADKMLTKNELTVARDIQLGLLPTEIPVPPGFEVAASSDVANSVGGDYYDAVPLGRSGMLYALADVSGKGISAALYTTTVQAALRIYAGQTSDPARLIRLVGSYMQERLRRSYFLTMALFTVTAGGAVRVARAGHPRPFHVSGSRKHVSMIDAQGAAIGLGVGGESGSVDKVLRSVRNVRLTMKKGDLLVLVSDGVLEAATRSGEEYGEKRLMALLQTFCDESPSSIKARLLADLTEFRGDADLRDDVTFLILKRT